MNGLLLSIAANAQGFERLTEFENNYLKPLFPIVAGIVFIGGALINIGKFFGENRDIKQGLINMFVYIGVLFLIAALYTLVRSISL